MFSRISTARISYLALVVFVSYTLSDIHINHVYMDACLCVCTGIKRRLKGETDRQSQGYRESSCLDGNECSDTEGLSPSKFISLLGFHPVADIAGGVLLLVEGGGKK